MYLSNHAEDIPEKNFIDEYLSTFNTRPISICSSPGMGKSVLLANLANKMRKVYPERIVIFLELRDIIKNLDAVKPKMEIKLVRKILASHILQDKLGEDILINLMSNRGINFEVFLDGFDEIPMEYLEVTKDFLACLIKSHNIRTFITSRPHMRDELELITEVISFDIAPFQKEDQMKFLCNFWTIDQNNTPLQKHQQFASIVLESLEEVNTDRNSNEFAGIPLQCYMLADVYAKDARRHASLESFSFNFTRCLSDLYDQFMHFKFQSIEGKEREFVKMIHFREALNILFPDSIMMKEICRNLNHMSDKLESWLIPGIMELRNSHETPVFVHKSFAEYLVAEFVVDHIILHPTLEEDVSKKFVLESLLSSTEMSREVEIAETIKKGLTTIETSAHWQKINLFFASPLYLTHIRFPTKKNYDTLSTMLPPVLQQKNKVTSLVANWKRYLNDSKSGKLKRKPVFGTGKFALEHPNICFFVNAALGKREKNSIDGVLGNGLLANEALCQNVQEKVVTCARHGFRHIIQMLIRSCLDNSGNKGFLQFSLKSCVDLIIGAVRNDDLELYKYCCDIVAQSLLKNVSHDNFTADSIITLTLGYAHLREAVTRGNYKLTEYVLNQFGDKVRYMPDLWKCSLQSSSKTSSSTIENKKRIIKLLKHVVKNHNIEHLNISISDEICVELFICFCDVWDYVPSKKDVSLMSGNLTRRFTHDKEMDMLVNWLISQKRTFLLFQKCEREQNMLFDALFLNVLSPETLCKIYNSHKFDLGDILHESVLCKRSEAMMKTIVQLSGDVNMTDANKNTFLHWAAFYKKINSIKYLLSVGANVNCTESLGNTPLHLILLDTTMPYNCQLAHDCVQLLLDHNADVLATNKYNQTPAGLCQVTTTTTDIHKQTVLLLKRKQFTNRMIKFCGAVLEIYVKLFIVFPSSICGWLSKPAYQRLMKL